MYLAGKKIRKCKSCGRKLSQNVKGDFCPDCENKSNTLRKAAIAAAAVMCKARQ